jgi:ethanolamine utilization protein EutM
MLQRPSFFYFFIFQLYDMRDELALGLIETRGLIAALEAADAALKAADVNVISLDRVDAALVTVKLVGEVAAVQSAVDAGSAAAARVGQLVGSHVIPRPDAELNDQLIYTTISSKKKPAVEKSAKSKSPKQESAKTDSGKPAVNVVTIPEAEIEVLSSDESDEDDTVLPIDSVAVIADEASLNAMSVQDLRRFARTIQGFPIQGREISRSDKQSLITLILQHKK